jgi:hypothetical protein
MYASARCPCLAVVDGHADVPLEHLCAVRHRGCFWPVCAEADEGREADAEGELALEAVLLAQCFAVDGEGGFKRLGVVE